MRLWIPALLLSMVGGTAVAGDLVTKEITYKGDGTELKGYLAYDQDVEGKRPGVLVVHEWWGMNDYARERARMLAKLGYTAFALDMYGEGKTATHPKEAGEFATAVNKDFPEAKRRFLAGLDVLRSQPTVDAEQVAAIGYCFGGGVVLKMARAGVDDLAGVVSFHGALGASQPPRQGDISAKILVLAGGADQLVPQEQVQQFRKEMEQAGADYKVIVYPGAQHSFTNPEADAYAKKYGIPIGYDAEADRKSWQAMKDFLEQVFSE